MPSEQQNLTRDEYQQLLEELTQAHDSLPGKEVKLRRDLRERMVDVRDILSAFAEQDLHANTTAFKALQGKIDGANQKLQELQADLEKTAQHVAIAGKIAAAMDKAASAAAKFFA